jgi:hypothetical protein
MYFQNLGPAIREVLALLLGNTVTVTGRPALPPCVGGRRGGPWAWPVTQLHCKTDKCSIIPEIYC